MTFNLKQVKVKCVQNSRKYSEKEEKHLRIEKVEAQNGLYNKEANIADGWDFESDFDDDFDYTDDDLDHADDDFDYTEDEFDEDDGLVFIDLDREYKRNPGTSKKRSSGKAGSGKKKKRSKKKNSLKIRYRVLTAAAAIILLFTGLGSGFLFYREMGGRRLRKEVENSAPDLAEKQETEHTLDTIPQEEEWQEDWVRYQGQVYDYNEDILTFLFMGIDKNDGTVQKVAEGTDGGQADALFLLVMDPHDRTADIIGINRNTMAAIDMYDEQGQFVNTITAQIAIQHGFGNGVEESCEYQTDAVSRLFYQLPIHGYAALNMSAITRLNDAVGGVDVIVLEDLTKKDPSLIEGRQVHLEGQSAFWYVKYRDTGITGSADGRLERQKQYLKSFADAAKAAVKKNPFVVRELYQAASPMMITDISMDEVLYLATEALDYHIADDSFHMLAGESTEGELFEEFYIDETALYELILEIFYEPVLTFG